LLLEECCGNSKQISSQELHSIEEFTFLPHILQEAIKTHQFKRGEGKLICKGTVKNQLPSA
jgi:hypothetical protein